MHFTTNREPPIQTYVKPIPINNNPFSNFDIPKTNRMQQPRMNDIQRQRRRQRQVPITCNPDSYANDQDSTTELVICMDSNMKFLNLRKLWTMNDTFVRRCSNIREVNEFIDGMQTHINLKYFFVSVGCNDLDTKSGDEVFVGMKNIIEKLRRKFSGIKIILSEITRRMDMHVNIKIYKERPAFLTSSIPPPHYLLQSYLISYFFHIIIVLVLLYTVNFWFHMASA